MRGFNGVFILKGDVKQASIARCEQIYDTDEIVHNGNRNTFVQLKAMWLKQESICWKFDDIPKKNNQENSEKEEEKVEDKESE